MLERATEHDGGSAEPPRTAPGGLLGPVAGTYGNEALPGQQEHLTGVSAGSYLSRQNGNGTTLQPWVSVVIPTYNRIEFLGQAIESILDQDYPNIECIVVDAASTDGTIELLKRYGERITWISRPDRGAFDAINEGWKMSKGEILAWVNSDDVWDKGAASLAVSYFRDHPDVDVLYGACGAIDEHGKLVDEYPPRSWDLEFALENCDHIINQTASFMRRRIIEEVGYLYPAWCHDHDLWLRIAAAGGTFGTTSRRLGSARIWPGNLGNNPRVIVPGKVGLTQRFFSNPKLPRRIKRLKRRAISNSYLRCIYYVRPTLRNVPVAAKLMLQACLADPPNIFYLLGQVDGLLLRHTPIPATWHTMWSAGRSMGRRLGRVAHFILVQPFQTMFAAFGSVAASLGHSNIGAVWRMLAPVAAVTAAAVLVIEADLPTDEAAEAFALFSLPLLAMVFLSQAPWRRDR